MIDQKAPRQLKPWRTRKLSGEGSRRLRILLYGTPEEQAELLAQCDREAKENEHKYLQERAYLLWEAAGYPGGRDVEFWLEAERQFQKECDEYEPLICNGVAY